MENVTLNCTYYYKKGEKLKRIVPGTILPNSGLRINFLCNRVEQSSIIFDHKFEILLFIKKRQEK